MMLFFGIERYVKRVKLSHSARRHLVINLTFVAKVLLLVAQTLKMRPCTRPRSFGYINTPFSLHLERSFRN